MGSDGCAFCSIIDGTAPATVLAADDLAVAFLPRSAVAPGHTLVAPRRHAADLFEVHQLDLAGTLVLAKRVAAAVAAELDAGGVNLLHASGAAAGQSVLHLHLHVVPRWPGDGLTAWPVGRSSRAAPEGLGSRLAARLTQ